MHYEVFDNNKTLPESVDSVEDQIPDQLYAVLYLMAVDMRDLKEIMFKEAILENTGKDEEASDPK